MKTNKAVYIGSSEDVENGTATGMLATLFPDYTSMAFIVDMVSNHMEITQSEFEAFADVLTLPVTAEKWLVKFCYASINNGIKTVEDASILYVYDLHSGIYYFFFRTQQSS